MVNQRMLGLGTARSVIRELFEYGKIRAAQVGSGECLRFLPGQPQRPPAPRRSNDTAVRILRGAAGGHPLLHQRPGGTRRPASASPTPQPPLRHLLYRRPVLHYRGGRRLPCCVFNGLTCPGDEFVVFAPYFPEYKVFIEGAGAKMVLIPRDRGIPDRL